MNRAKRESSARAPARWSAWVAGVLVQRDLGWRVLFSWVFHRGSAPGLLLGLVGCAHLRPVDEGVVYRQEKPSDSELRLTLEEKSIRTVVNLDGFAPEANWYQSLRAVCAGADVQVVDLSLDGAHLEREEMIRLLETMRGAAKPVLLYSRVGHSGFAAGFYRLVVLEESHAAARGELAPWQWQVLPVDRWKGPDRFLAEWRDDETFFTNYQVSEQARPPIVAPDRFLADVGRTQATVTASKPLPRAKTWWQDWLARQDHASLFRVSDYRGYQESTFVRDYKTVIVDGPVSRGPVLVGRATRRPAHRPTSSTDVAPGPTLGLPVAAAD